MFFQRFDHYQGLDTNILNHDMQNRQNLMHFELLKWLKTSFWPIFGPNWPIFGPANFFSALGQPLGTRYRYSQS